MVKISLRAPRRADGLSTWKTGQIAALSRIGHGFQ
jgi:hypothetical protein